MNHKKQTRDYPFLRGVVNGVSSSNLYPFKTALEIHSFTSTCSHLTDVLLLFMVVLRRFILVFYNDCECPKWLSNEFKSVSFLRYDLIEAFKGSHRPSKGQNL